MLSYIQIKNFTIIDELELTFHAGMTVLTGETGAGKSILIDALNLALGARADVKMIRPDCDRCEIIASFQLQHMLAAQKWLRAHELDAGDECIFRRIINEDGRSQAFINGQLSTLQQIKELGQLLLTIHGQHEHQLLLDRNFQRQFLDAYAGLEDLLADVAMIYQSWKYKNTELEKYREPQGVTAAQLELLNYQISELEQLNIHGNTVNNLHAEQKQLSHGEELLENTQQALNYLSEAEPSVLTTIHAIVNLLHPVLAIDPRMNSAHDLLQNALIQLKEASAEIKTFVDKIEINPERLREVEKHLDVMHALARKHHIDIEQLPLLQQHLQEKIDSLTLGEKNVAQLTQDIAELEKHYQEIAEKLSVSRQQAADKLSAAVTKSLHDLGMPNGQFKVTVSPQENTAPTLFGLDRIEFLVQTNPGQNLQPLAKIVSGGELSRISLAITVLTAQAHAIPTMIFDEVDTGIGGGIAEIVGKLMNQLSKKTQVLCVTHLPQVAAQAQHHVQILKLFSRNRTSISIRLLNSNEKVKEIARMLGGVKITERTLEHARELLMMADEMAG